MNTTYVYLLIFGCIAYLIVTDQSVARAVFYITEIIKNKFFKFYWWVLNNPRLPWVKYQMYRRSMKIAEELMKEFEEKR